MYTQTYSFKWLPILYVKLVHNKHFLSFKMLWLTDIYPPRPIYVIYLLLAKESVFELE